MRCLKTHRLLITQHIQTVLNECTSTDVILYMWLNNVHMRHLRDLLKCRVYCLGPDLGLKHWTSYKLPGDANVGGSGVTFWTVSSNRLVNKFFNLKIYLEIIERNCLELGPKKKKKENTIFFFLILGNYLFNSLPLILIWFRITFPLLNVARKWLHLLF